MCSTVFLFPRSREERLISGEECCVGFLCSEPIYFANRLEKPKSATKQPTVSLISRMSSRTPPTPVLSHLLQPPIPWHDLIIQNPTTQSLRAFRDWDIWKQREASFHSMWCLTTKWAGNMTSKINSKINSSWLFLPCNDKRNSEP